ncbi:type IIL restriction-modification enzyme MmeI [Bifidobacterium pullorum]|uniref:type IIL restriction-modification enzyme MmeI n=1 Tax=Bifidobacterium pullorum TaxID=78448 RepID=UPI003F1FDAB0
MPTCWYLTPDGRQFGFISSSMFIIWQRTLGGRIKSDYRFSSILMWNTDNARFVAHFG